MTDTAIVLPPPAQKQPLHARLLLQQAAFWSVIAGIACVALLAGLHLRRYAWDQTEPIRYVADIDNAFYQGTQTLNLGYIERYDEQVTRPDLNSTMALDYAPGRLAVATLWTRWVWEQLDEPVPKISDVNRSWHRYFYDHARETGQQYELCQPMLMLNLTGEILSAIAMFFLVRRYTMGKPPVHRPWRGAILGLIAAMFFWFDPALISNAHCWPQWDSWVIPFFLWAVLLASLDWWFCAGLVVAGATMFKAQILFAAPLFILWPLFQGRLVAILRWVVGLLIATAAINAVWLVRTPGKNPTGRHYIASTVDPNAITWIIYAAAIFLAVVPAAAFWRHPRARIPASVAVAAVIGWIISAHAGSTFSMIGFLALAIAAAVLNERFGGWGLWARVLVGCVAGAILLYPAIVLTTAPNGLSKIVEVELELLAIIGLGLLVAYAPRRVIPFAAAGWIAAAVLLCVPMFGTSKAWFDRGIAFGTHHYEKMASGDNNNLPELLQKQWEWNDLMEPVVKLPKGWISDTVAHFLVNVDPGVRENRVEGSENNFERADGKEQFLHLDPGEVGVPLKYVLVCVWGLSVVLCAIGTAVQDRRRSPRFLASIAAPWIMFFAVMTQMHQRYLLWGGSISAATAVISPGYAILHLFLSVVSMGQEMTSMMNNHLDPSRGVNYTDNPMFEFFHRWHPGVAWAVLLTACIFVYTSVKLDRVRKSPKSETRNPKEIPMTKSE